MTKILIVEDDQLLLQTFSNMLKHEGFEVVSTTHLDWAMDYLHDGNLVDLLLLDIWLDGQPSFELIDVALKTQPSPSIVVMSGGGGSMSIEVASSLARMKGISAFIQKPVERVALVEHLRQSLSDAQQK